MTEEPPKIPPLAAAFPNGFPIAEELVAKWVEIPDTEAVLIGPLSRKDLDQLLFAFRDLASGVAHLRDAVLLFSQGRVEEGNQMIANSTTAIIDGESRNRALFKAIIESVLKVRDAAR